MSNFKIGGRSVEFCASCGKEHINTCLCDKDGAKCGFCLAAVEKAHKTTGQYNYSWEFLCDDIGVLRLVTEKDLNGKTPVQKTVQARYETYWEAKLPYKIIDGKKTFTIKKSEMPRLHKIIKENDGFVIERMYSYGERVF